MQSSKQRSVNTIMKNQSIGNMIATLRREKGLTQLQLAKEMGVTDKAVSKWERDLSFPDVDSIPRLAEILGISVDELLQVKTGAAEETTNRKISEMIDLALKGVALAMGVAVAVLSCIDKIEISSAIAMLGIGLACLAVTQFSRKEE